MKLNTEDCVLNSNDHSGYPGSKEQNTEGSICFRFTGREVAEADVRRFTSTFSPGQLDASVLCLLRGNLVIHLPPSAARHQEPFLCETTRRFCRVFFEAFPAWGFFFSLENLALWKMSIALLGEARFFQFDRAWKTRVLLPGDLFGALIGQHQKETRTMALAAGMPEAEAEHLAGAVQAYF